MKEYVQSHFVSSFYNLKAVNVLFIFLCTFHGVFFAMKRSNNTIISTTNKKIKKEPKIKIEPGILPQRSEIKNDLVPSRDHITACCIEYNNEINALSKNILMHFKKSCGLTPHNWNCFIQEASKIKDFKNKFSIPPHTFQQYITEAIEPNLLEKLKNNCNANQVCFKKINILESKDIPEFTIQTPFYALSTRNPGKFIFSPDILILNSNAYKNHSDFFNICIIAAFRQEIMRIMHIFNLIHQTQIAQKITVETSHLKCVNFSVLAQNALQLDKHITFFIRNYGFRIGILRLTLKNQRIAHIFDNYLTNNPTLCSRYGITQEDHEFFRNIKKLEDLKKIEINEPLPTSPEDNDYLSFVSELGLDPNVFS